jgi:predicted nucleic acid-binding protein
MPFTNRAAAADTNVLTDFFTAGCLELLWQLFPDGLWLDASVLMELQESHDDELLRTVRHCGWRMHGEKNRSEQDYGLMQSIKGAHPALKHPDIACVVLAKKYGLTCLSADQLVFKTCGELRLPVVRHVGLLEESIERGLIAAAQASDFLNAFLDNGLYLPRVVIDRSLEKWALRQASTPSSD